jgi:hypothetical protein
MEAARLFTYDAYLDAVRKMFWDAWGIDLGRQKGLAR